MRVLLCSELFWPHIGGAEILMANFMTAMQKRGFQFAVATSHSARDLPDRESYNGIPIHRFHFHRVLSERNINQIKILRTQVADLRASFKPDLVHFNNVTPDTFFHQQTASVYPAGSLVTLHGFLSVPNLSKNTLIRKTLLASDWIVGVSNFVLNQARQILPEISDMSSVIHNGLEIPTALPKPLPFNPGQILGIGRLFTLKGFDLALEAFSRIHKIFPDVRLIIAGDGPAKQDLIQQSINLKLENDVEFLGWVKPDEVPGLINQSTAVIMPSRTESLPLVALQTAQMARPIVATNVGGLPEVVEHAYSGLLVDSEDIQGLADSLLYLLQYPEAASLMGANARQRVQELFSWDGFLDQYEELYYQILRK